MQWWILKYLASENFVLANESNLSLAEKLVKSPDNRLPARPYLVYCEVNTGSNFLSPHLYISATLFVNLQACLYFNHLIFLRNWTLIPGKPLIVPSNLCRAVFAKFSFFQPNQSWLILRTFSKDENGNNKTHARFWGRDFLKLSRCHNPQKAQTPKWHFHSKKLNSEFL